VDSTRAKYWAGIAFALLAALLMVVTDLPVPVLITLLIVGIGLIATSR
jgi:hypothetical protein